MNKEIKEILDRLDKIAKGDYYPEDLLYYENCKQLLDYITNLQEENKRLIKNQRYYKNGVFSLEYDKETLSDMIDDYKSRIDKAIEYIKEYNLEGVKLNSDYWYDCLIALLEILEGKDNE